MVLIGLATQALQRGQADALARLGSAWTEAVEGLATLKVFGRARRQVGRIGAVTDEYRRGTIGVLRLSFVSGFALELAASLSVALVAVTIGIRLVDGIDGPGGGDVRPGARARGLRPRSARSVPTSTRPRTASRPPVRSSTSSTTPTTRRRRAPRPTTRRRSGAAADALVLRGVTVHRDDTRIGPVDLDAPRGSVVVLTGPSGSGKSSLIAAIRGVLPHDGAVTVPGPAGSTRAERIAWADQRPRLLRGTIAENVALSATPDDDAVRSALGAVGLGLDPGLPVGSGGTGLSGGQAQRVAVARALYRHALAGTALVLLDEPTSALDADAEATVVAALRRLADQGAVVVVASHRPAVVAAADLRVAVDGAVTGAHA